MKRDGAAVRALLGQKVDVNAPGKDGTPALHWAVREDDLATARLLLGAGADAELANRYGVTPLFLACCERQRGDDPAAARCRRRSECVGSDRRDGADGGRARRNARRREAAARSRRGARRQGSGVPADGADGGGQGKPSRRCRASGGARRGRQCQDEDGRHARVRPAELRAGLRSRRGHRPRRIARARPRDPIPGSAVSALLCRARRPARDRADARGRRTPM